MLTSRRISTHLSALAVAGVAAVAVAAPASAAGVWQDSEASPTTVRSKNVWNYSKTFTPPADTTGTIGRIEWRYDASYPLPATRMVELCDVDWGACLPIDAGSGVTYDFEGAPGDHSFILRFGVTGSGTMQPWTITNKQVTVWTS